jgi:hypothetical protein
MVIFCGASFSLMAEALGTGGDEHPWNAPVMSYSGGFDQFYWGFVLCASIPKCKESPVLPGLILVGARGFEPPTPSLPD